MQSSASAPAAAPPADVPRKLATDLYLGELASAANEELLRALGISHILVVAAGGAASATTVAAAARSLGARLGVVDDASASVLDGEEDNLLAECCAFVAEGCGSGGALVAGPLYDTTERLPAAVVAACAAALAAAAPPPRRARAAPRRARRCTRRSSSAASSSRAAASARPPPPPPPAFSTVKAAKRWGGAELGSDSDDSTSDDDEPSAAPVRSGRWLRLPIEDAPEVAEATPPPPDAAAVAATGAGLALHTAALTLAPAAPASATPSVVYRCQKCRVRLFSSDVLEAHEPGGGEQAFSRRQRSGGNGGGGGAEGACTSLFLQSDAAEALSMVEGKLACPKCATRLGSFNWSGAQCSCGAWVTPAVQVVRSRVDEWVVRPC